ncbi:MAG: hypothetical protein NTV86_04555 [Planctomycetota bacterium]|nr:hypothetical protein [Planctomycetota bacterium]
MYGVIGIVLGIVLVPVIALIISIFDPKRNRPFAYMRMSKEEFDKWQKEGAELRNNIVANAKRERSASQEQVQYPECEDEPPGPQETFEERSWRYAAEGAQARKQNPKP